MKPLVSMDAQDRGNMQRSVLPAMVLLPFWLLMALHWRELPALVSSDYAQYLSHARALVEGRPYGDIGYLWTRFNPLIGPRVQPPGWPLLLAPFVAVFGVDSVWPRLLVVLAVSALLVLVFRYFARRGDVALGVAAAAATGVALESMRATNTPIADLPFAALVWLLIHTADREGRWSWSRTSAIALIGLYAMSTRVVGVSLVLGVALYALIGVRQNRFRAAAVLGAWGGIGVLVFALKRPEIPFLRLLFRAPDIYYARLLTAWEHYRFSTFEALMYPFPADALNDAYHLLFVAFMVVGMVWFIRAYLRTMLAAVIATYVLALLVAPVAEPRYLWPVWPVIIACAFAGVRTVWSLLPLKGAVWRRAGITAGVLLLAGGMLTGARRPAPPSLLGRETTQELLQWIRTEHSAQPMRVMFTSPRVLTLETDVPAMGPFVATPEATRHELARQRITHVITGSGGNPFQNQPEWAAVFGADSAFQRVHSNSDYAVYRFVAPPAAHHTTSR